MKSSKCWRLGKVAFI